MMINPSDGPLPDPIVINRELAIPLHELRFRYSRSGGPGGQHVNRTETRVELLYDVASSPSLNEAQRQRLRQRLSGYIDGDGILRVVSSTTRSQLENRGDAVARFAALLAAALHRNKHRIATRPTTADRERRLSDKKAHSAIKRQRRTERHSDE